MSPVRLPSVTDEGIAAPFLPEGRHRPVPRHEAHVVAEREQLGAARGEQLLMVAGFGLLLAWHLWHMGVYDGADSLRMGFFHVLSFSSTTGLTAAAVDTWPDFDRYVLFLLVFVGGCIGSPTGGIRIW